MIERDDEQNTDLSIAKAMFRIFTPATEEEIQAGFESSEEYFTERNNVDEHGVKEA